MFKIGTIAILETMEDAERMKQDEWHELKLRVIAETKRRKVSRYADFWIYGKIAAIGFMVGGSFLSILSSKPSLSWLLLWAILGIAAFFLLVNCAHDASHGVLFKSRYANKIALHLSFGLFGIDGALWGLRHLVAHHPRTNISEEDPDSVPNPFLRLSPHHPWFPWFRLQPYYAFFIYALALPHTTLIQDFDHLINRPLPYLKKIDRKIVMRRMLSIKALYLALFIGLPILCGIPLTWALAGVVVKMMAASLVFVSTIALNHYVMETTFYPAHTKRAEETYLLHNLKSSADWFPRSRWVCSLMGGANAHVAHHLFPYLSHRHYYWISDIIEKFCQERDLPYHQFTFLGGIKSHYKFLKMLGRRPV